MRQEARAPLADPLQRARASAHAPGEFVGQERFIGALEILALAEAAGIAPGVSVLDLSRSGAGLITRELGCEYRAAGLGDPRHGSAIAQIPPIPRGSFDVVLLLETLVAVEDKERLVRAVCRSLAPGGRLAFTTEVGLPLSDQERESLPGEHAVWPIPLAELRAILERAGLVVRWRADHSRAHRIVADALVHAVAADAEAIAAQIGRPSLDELLATHRLWSRWLRDGRMRALAVVARVP